MEHNPILINGYPSPCPHNGEPFPNMIEMMEWESTKDKKGWKGKDLSMWKYWSSPVYGGGSVDNPGSGVIGLYVTGNRTHHVECKRCGIRKKLW